MTFLRKILTCGSAKTVPWLCNGHCVYWCKRQMVLLYNHATEEENTLTEITDWSRYMLYLPYFLSLCVTLQLRTSTRIGARVPGRNPMIHLAQQR
jgi:hypothetical protein